MNRTQQDGEENRAGTGPSCDHGELSLTWEAGVQASRLLGKETLLLFLDQKKNARGVCFSQEWRDVSSCQPRPWLPLAQPENTRLLSRKGVLDLPLLLCAALGDPGPSLDSAVMGGGPGFDCVVVCSVTVFPKPTLKVFADKFLQTG